MSQQSSQVRQCNSFSYVDFILYVNKSSVFCFVVSLTWACNPLLFKSLLVKYELDLIVQIHTTSLLQSGNYVYCSSCVVADHVISFRSQLQQALELGAVIVNCHSGHDSWNLEKGLSYFQQVLAIENELVHDRSEFRHVIVVHETHRQRLLHSPYQAVELLSRPELRQLKVNADLSHWVLFFHTFNGPLSTLVHNIITIVYIAFMTCVSCTVYRVVGVCV